MNTQTLLFAKKNFRTPDAVKDCGHGVLEVATVEDTTLARMTLQPGWRWSEHVGPVFNTQSCPVNHAQYVVSGRLAIVMDDGSQSELEPGDFACIAAGHDAWVVGNEPFVCIDFSPDMKQFAQDSEQCGHS